MPLLTQQRLTCKVLCRLCPVGCSQGLKDVVKELLIEFVRANNGTKPARIIFFRDGVSEGEFLKVKNSSSLSIYSKSHLLSRTVAWVGQNMREYTAVARLGSCRLHKGLCWLTNSGSEQVQEAEIPQVFAAVAELQRSEAAGIPITYIVCQKRHMTRLFPGERGAGDRNGNVLPGEHHCRVSLTRDPVCAFPWAGAFYT